MVLQSWIILLVSQNVCTFCLNGNAMKLGRLYKHCYEFHNPFEACICSDLLNFAAVSIKI